MERSQDLRSPERHALLKPLKLFALGGSEDLGASIAGSLGTRLAAHEERGFEDGEHKVRPLEPGAGADVYVVYSLYGGPIQSPHDKLCRLLFFIGALKDAGARRVTAVLLPQGPPDKEPRPCHDALCRKHV
ncbi:MAG: ribose-phosphate pyrophosphokinase-like domain-containing protein [Rhodomicrobium sp.]